MKSENESSDSDLKIDKCDNDNVKDENSESLYALYDIQNTTQISVVSTNLPAITAEKLEQVLLEKLKTRGSDPPSSNCDPASNNDPSTSNSGMFRLNMESGPLSCYYHLLTQTSLFTSDAKVSEFIHVASHNSLLVVMASPWEGIFELFSLEVERLISNLQTCGDKKIFMEDLQNWYKICIEYLTRVTKNVSNTDLAVVLEVAMRQGEIATQDVSPEFASDLQKFIECCSFNFLDHAPKNKPLLAVYKKNAFESSTDLSSMSQSWAKDLISYDAPVRVRQNIEWHKLKGIQDLNTLKRHTKKAGNDYYELHEAHKFLSKTGYPFVLLSHLSKQNDVSIEDEEIITMLKEYLSFVNLSH